MPTEAEQANLFASLHQKGTPLVLYNCWDAGGAQILAELGAKAIATGSYSVGKSHGVGDAEAVPIPDVVANLKRIVSSVELPVTLDFEGGYSAEPEQLKANVTQVIAAGAVGINFEDQVVGTDQIYAVDVQSKRISAIREAADEANVPFFINARTDLFLKNERESHASFLDEAIERAKAYQSAGSSGFFAPGLADPQLIKQLCEACPLPVNIMIWPHVPGPRELAELGVSRISYGGGPWHVAMQTFTENAKRALALES